MKLKMLGASFLFLLAAGCSSGSGSGSSSGGGGTVDTGTGTGDTSTDSRSLNSDALSVGSTALAEAFAQDSASLTRAALTEITEDCSTSGSWTLNGTYDDDITDGIWSYDFTLAFNPCDGIDGELEYSGDYTFSETAYSYNSTINGVIGGNGCTLTYDDYGYIFSFDSSDSSYSYIVDGSFSSDCGGEVFACTFDNTDISDEDALLAACTLDGEPVTADDGDDTELTFEGDIESFFDVNSGSHIGTVTANEGNVGTDFTDGNSYNVTVSEDGGITIETDGEDIVLDFSNGHYFESNDSEATFTWKDGEELNVTFQNEDGDKTLVVVIDTDSNTDVWTFALTLE